MMHDRPATRAEDHVQREADYQRWADDGGRIPNSQLDISATAPITLPMRLIYRRPIGGHLFLPMAVSTVTSAPIL